MFNFAQKTADYLFGKGYLSGGYAVAFLVFVLVCITFIIWAIYYATARGGISELKKVSWLSKKNTLKLTSIVVLSVVAVSLILFAYDLGLDKLVNFIISNADNA